jgi:heat-inducible transcriptional repressor
MLEQIKQKPSIKEERQHKVLIALIEHYILTGKPVGSNTLRESGLEDLSSATIRNYFASLEDLGFLEQQHSSGGRTPTEKAFRLYAEEIRNSFKPKSLNEEKFKWIRQSETKEIAALLQKGAETLSSLANCAVFLSAPRFDHDIIVDIKLVPVDSFRFLCVIITDFGVIQTELMHTEDKLSSFGVKRMETYFQWRLGKNEKPENLSPEEEHLAQKFYNEIIMRYIVGYSNFINEEVFRTGFSKLLSYPEFNDPISLASSLSLFENAHSMRLLLRETARANQIKFWIGNDLDSFTTTTPHATVIAMPYKINQQTIGAFGILVPTRTPYRKVFELMHAFSESISEALTRNIYKFKINFRQPQEGSLYLQKEEHRLIGQSRLMLLEDKHKKGKEE